MFICSSFSSFIYLGNFDFETCIFDHGQILSVVRKLSISSLVHKSPNLRMNLNYRHSTSELMCNKS